MSFFILLAAFLTSGIIYEAKNRKNGDYWINYTKNGTQLIPFSSTEDILLPTMDTLGQ